jgi:hypothetical protein
LQLKDQEQYQREMLAMAAPAAEPARARRWGPDDGRR